MKKIYTILLVLIISVTANWTSVSAATTSTTIKDTTLETYYKILEQRHWENGVYSLKGKSGELIDVSNDQDTIYQTLKPGVAYAKLIDFDGNGTEELYLHYVTVSSNEGIYATAEIWTINKGKAKLALKEKIQSDGSHAVDGKPILFCKVKGKTYLISQTSFSTGAGYFDSQSESSFLVREFVNGKISEKYTLDETWTDLNEFSEQYKQYGDTTIYEWQISKNGKKINSGKKTNAGEDFHAKEISKIKNVYKNPEKIIGAGTYEILSCKINSVDSCLKSIREKITNSKLKNTLAQKVKSSQPSMIVKSNASSITIQEFDNFYSDGEGEMKPRKDKKSYSVDEYTVFTMLNDQYENETVSKTNFMKNCGDRYYIINYKGKRVISISEVYHP